MGSNHYLNEIIAHKKQEIQQLLTARSNDNPSTKRLGSVARLSDALKKTGLTVIAEIKRRSPSKGILKMIEDPTALAHRYVQGGAGALSVLTDSFGFGGHLKDLSQVAKNYPSIPVLRKDFILHAIQLQEALEAGASAVLLIAGVLGKELVHLHQEAIDLGLEALVEVHCRDELNLAVDSGATIIGINHRNLNTFEMDLSLSEVLRPHIPSNVLAVAESGIHTVEHAQHMASLNYHGILVGEALVNASDPSVLINNMRGTKP